MSRLVNSRDGADGRLWSGCVGCRRGGSGNVRVLTLCSLVTTPPEPVLEGQWAGPASYLFSKAWGAPDCSWGQV